MTIDEHTDLELARYNLQTDQTALDAIGAAIAQEQNRRNLAPTMAAFEAMKNAKEKRRVNHASLVIDCRKAKDKLAKLATATARHEDSVTHADNDLARANFALRAHARPDPNSYPLPEELAAWDVKHADLTEKMLEAARGYDAARGEYQASYGEQQVADQEFRALAERELALRRQLES